MALSAKVGTFTPPGSTGNYAVTGVGFTPKALLLFVYKNQSTANGGPLNQVVGQSIGFAAGSGSTQQVCAAWNVRGDSNYTTSVRWKEGAIASGSSSGANVVYIDASLASFDADGFTLNFASASTDFTAWYLVLGGSDLTQVALTALDTPTTTGTQAKTGVGFQPDALMFLSSAFNATSTSGYQSNGGAPQLGVCASGGDYAVSNWGNTFAGATASYGRDDRAIVLLKDFSSNVWGDATLSSMDSDGFTLNWQAVSTEVTRIWALCLKGTSIKVGTTAQRTTTGTTAVTGLGFQPSALLMFSNGQVASASVANVAGMLNIGAATSTTNRQAATFGRAHNGSSYPGTAQTLANAKVALHHTPATSAPTGSTLAADADLSSFDADGFTLNWTTVDAIARTWGWIAFGAAGSSPQTLTGSAATSSWSVAGALGIATLALTGTVATASWSAPAGALSTGSVALSGSAAASTWTTPTQTLTPGTVALTGSAPTASWAVAGVFAQGAVALTGTTPTSSWTAPTQTLVAGAVTLSGSPAASSWAVGSGALAPGAVALSGATAASTWAILDGSFSASGAPQALSGVAATASWAVGSETLAPGAVSLSGVAAASSWTVPGGSFVAGTVPQTLVGASAVSSWAVTGVWTTGAAALSGATPEAAWAVAGALTSTVTLLGSPAEAAWTVPSGSFSASTSLAGTPAEATWLVSLGALTLAPVALVGSPSAATWTVPAGLMVLPGLGWVVEAIGALLASRGLAVIGTDTFYGSLPTGAGTVTSLRETSGRPPDLTLGRAEAIATERPVVQVVVRAADAETASARAQDLFQAMTGTNATIQAERYLRIWPKSSPYRHGLDRNHRALYTFFVEIEKELTR